MHAFTLGDFLAGSPTLMGASEAVWTLIPASAAIFLVVAVMYTKAFLYICKPNEILIFTGRDRGEKGPLIIRSHGKPGESAGGGQGRAWRTPIIERVERMDTRTMSIDVVVNNAYSKGNIPLNIHAIANVKLHSNPVMIRNAVERFLGRERNEIRLVAQQNLEGSVRDVLAQMTPEQVNEDRLTFAEKLMQNTEDDLEKLGLELDTLKIQNVADGTGYLDSLGRPRIAEVLRDAENAENQAMQETTEAEAMSKQRSQTAKAAAEAAVLSKGNELAQVRAELNGEAAAVEREAETAAKTARASAEKKLQEVRSILEQKRLQADVVIPAEAKREADALRAKGDAAPTVEDGKALVQVLEATTRAWNAMGPQAKEIYVIQHLEEIVEQVVEQMKGVKIKEVSVLDPGDGSGLSAYAASYPQAVASVLRALGETVGVDVPDVLAKPSKSGGFAPGRGV